MTILDKIITDKKLEVSARKNKKPLGVLKEEEFYSRTCFSLCESILKSEIPAIITEFKRKSPSKGIINAVADVLKTTMEYENSGAAAISVLTDNKYFGGSEEDILSIRTKINIPILRKEFIIDEYQVHEAKSIGADVILLIASCLTKQQVNDLTQVARGIGLSVLFEVHTEEEVEKMNDHIDIVGINNRNLKTFEVDIENSKKVFQALPGNCLKIAESGISNPLTLMELKAYGFDGFLMGENFMKQDNPGGSFRSFLKSLI